MIDNETGLFLTSTSEEEKELIRKIELLKITEEITAKKLAIASRENAAARKETTEVYRKLYYLRTSNENILYLCRTGKVHPILYMMDKCKHLNFKERENG